LPVFSVDLPLTGLAWLADRLCKTIHSKRFGSHYLWWNETMEGTMNPLKTFRAWRRYNETVRELNRLNTRQLADLGINRGDIERVARGAA
jgi:uncharacterized protein YjiS (DUF1127 family)